MRTLIYVTIDDKELLGIIKICLRNNISFEFINSNELYFAIYDDLDFEYKRSILGVEVISYKNDVFSF